MFFPLPVRLPLDFESAVEILKVQYCSVALGQTSIIVNLPSASFSIVKEEEGVQGFLA